MKRPALIFLLLTLTGFLRGQIPDSTLLPLIIIDTRGRDIPDEPRITADMAIIDHEGYKRPGDRPDAYEGQISIEMRGESSLHLYDKKSYSIETQNPDGSNNNVALLGLPKENDWVLYAPYGDKSLMRNVISYRLFEQMGHYAPRTRFAELIINGDYKGLYVLTEKIKRDKRRVNIMKPQPAGNDRNGITGGYLLRVDKLSKMPDEAWWESTVDPPIGGFSRTVFQFFDPEYDELNTRQKDYIIDYLFQFESAFAGPGFKDPVHGYRSYLDVASFIDLMILNEIAKDVDGFRLSHYFYKQHLVNGAKLVQGPPWDYNLSFGNSDYSPDIHETYNWTYSYRNTIFWWARAMQDPWFQNQLHCRWDELYEETLSKDRMMELIDSIRSPLDGAIERNFERWPILGIYIWPNYYVGESHAQEEEWLRSWILQRLSWIDQEWGGQCRPSSTALIDKPGSLHIYPNPSTLTKTYVDLPYSDENEALILLTDLNGRQVYHKQLTRLPSGPFQLPELSALPSGIYLLQLRLSDGSSFSAKLMKE